MGSRWQVVAVAVVASSTSSSSSSSSRSTNGSTSSRSRSSSSGSSSRRSRRSGTFTNTSTAQKGLGQRFGIEVFDLAVLGLSGSFRETSFEKGFVSFRCMSSQGFRAQS